MLSRGPPCPIYNWLTHVNPQYEVLWLAPGEMLERAGVFHWLAGICPYILSLDWLQLGCGTRDVHARHGVAWKHTPSQILNIGPPEASQTPRPQHNRGAIDWHSANMGFADFVPPFSLCFFWTEANNHKKKLKRTLKWSFRQGFSTSCESFYYSGLQ